MSKVAKAEAGRFVICHLPFAMQRKKLTSINVTVIAIRKSVTTLLFREFRASVFFRASPATEQTTADEGQWACGLSRKGRSAILGSFPLFCDPGVGTPGCLVPPLRGSFCRLAIADCRLAQLPHQLIDVPFCPTVVVDLLDDAVGTDHKRRPHDAVIGPPVVLLLAPNAKTLSE